MRKIGASFLALILATGMASPRDVQARTLQNTLLPSAVPSASIVGRAIAPLGGLIASQVANQLPSPSTSAGFTFEYDEQLGAFKRAAGTLGPLFSDRAVTVGRHKLNVATSFSYIKFTQINGHDINHLKNRFEFAKEKESGDLHFQGIQAEDEEGNAATDQVELDLNLDAQVFDFDVTYGITDNLDINVEIPVVRTYLRSAIVDTIPDPRCVDRTQECKDQLEALDGEYIVEPEVASRNSSLGIGDIRLRSKYLATRTPLNLAGTLELIIPSGDVENFHGTGDTRLGTQFIASKDIASIVEFHAQGGVDFTVNDVDRSQARYAAGFTVQPISLLGMSVDFLGRSEFGAQGRVPNTGRLPAVRNGVYTQTQEEIDARAKAGLGFDGRPLFFDIHRNDVLDLAVTLKFGLVDRFVVFASALIPLNDDGLRPDVVPTIGLESNFSL